MLSLPHNRRDYVFGKFIGRTIVLSTAILLGYGTATVIAALTYSSFSPRIVALYTLLTVLYGGVYVAVGLGLSVFTQSRTRAVAAAIGFYGLFLLFWDVFLLALQLATVGSSVPESGPPDWIEFVGLLNPATAFPYAARALVPEFAEITLLPEPSAVYLQNWIGFVVLAGWLVVPITVGYLRFARRDLA